MESKRTRQRWTYAEFARLPSEGSKRHEIVDGELFVTLSPTPMHQRVVTNLVTMPHDFVRSNRLGEVLVGPLDVLFAGGDYLEPDVLFLRAGRTGVLTDRGVEGPPDLVVEVISPSTAARDRGAKLDRYRLYGVAEYWLVDPEARTVEVWDLAAGASEAVVLGPADMLGWAPGPGDAALEITVAELFDAG